MSNAKVRNGACRIRNCIKSVREILLEHGCVDTMTVREAVTRLISEHKEAVDRARLAETMSAVDQETARLALKIRTAAQELATKNHEEARALRRENEQLRSEIEEQRRRIITLTEEAKAMRDALCEHPSMETIAMNRMD